MMSVTIPNSKCIEDILSPQKGSPMTETECPDIGEIGAMSPLPRSIIKPFDINEPDLRGHTPLANAIIADRDIMPLISKGADPNSKTRDGITMLMLAIKIRHRLTDLLSLRDNLTGKCIVDLDATDAEGNTALMIAVQKKYGVDELLRAKADVNKANDMGRTPLMYAARDDYCVDLLLKSGARVSDEDESGWQAISYGVCAGFVDPDLVLAGADLNGRMGFSSTLLTYAIENKKMCVLELLVANADPNLKDDNGDTPLICALKCDTHVEDVLSFCADVNIPDPDGVTPLMYAARIGKYVEMLIGLGADVNAVDDDGKTAYDVAIAYKNHDGALAIKNRMEKVNADMASAWHVIVKPICKK